MRIGVMLRTIDERQGIGVYTQNLMDHLLELDTPHEFFLFYKNADCVGRYARFNHVTEQAIAARTKPQWDQFAVLGAAKRTGVDLLFNTKFTVPVFSPIKTAMVLHGSEWWVYPMAYRLADRINIRIMMPWYCRRASRLIANSDMTKRDFVILP